MLVGDIYFGNSEYLQGLTSGCDRRKNSMSFITTEFAFQLLQSSAGEWWPFIACKIRGKQHVSMPPAHKPPHVDSPLQLGGSVATMSLTQGCLCFKINEEIGRYEKFGSNAVLREKSFMFFCHGVRKLGLGMVQVRFWNEVELKL